MKLQCTRVIAMISSLFTSNFSASNDLSVCLSCSIFLSKPGTFARRLAHFSLFGLPLHLIQEIVLRRVRCFSFRRPF
jgi:hypothetical protein